MGITAQEQAEPPKTRVQEVASDQPGVRIFVVHSDERLAYERAQRLTAMARVRTQLQALERRVAQGRLKAPARIGAAAARILGRFHGYRYYDWEYTPVTDRSAEWPERRQRVYRGPRIFPGRDASVPRCAQPLERSRTS